jgi:hypothetical protein
VDTGVDDASGTEAAVADASPNSSNILYVAAVGGQCDGNAPIAMCRVSVDVFVHDPSGARIDDAMVTVNDVAVPLVGAGHYSTRYAGWPASFVFVVAHNGERSSSTLHAPGDFSAALVPAQPAAGTSAMVTWNPANEPDVEASLRVYDARGLPVSDTTTSDTGASMLPADAFPMSGSYSVEVARRWYLPDALSTDPMGSASNVRLSRTLPVAVP